jgi:hypothetical protein
MNVPRWTLPASCAAVACVAVLWITRPPGPGLDPDAMSYLGAAESLASHGTLRVPTGSWNDPDGWSPLAHFPAGFSLVLAGPIALGADPVQAARGVEALAAAATAGLLVWLVMVVAGPRAAALAGVSSLVTPGLALDHLRVLSEPLFLALLAWTLLVMVRRPDRPLWYGVVAALAAGVRYAGVALGGAAVLWALSRPAPLRRRLWSALLAGTPTAVVQAAWTLRADVESAQVRSFGLKSGLGPTFREGWDTLSGWLAPGLGQSVLRATVALAVWMTAAARQMAATVREARDGGWGYGAEDWRASEVVRWLRTEGAGFAIFSDDPADVWFATGRRSWTLPATADADSAAAFGEVLRRRHGALVGFANPLGPMAVPSALAARLSLPLLARFGDAVVWGPPAQADGYEEAPRSGARRR